MSLYRRNQSPYWYGEYTEANGRRVQRSTKTRNKQQAARILSKWQSEAADLTHGITNQGNGDIGPLLDEWIEYLANTGDKHQYEFRQKVQRILDAADICNIRQLDQYSVEATVRKFQTLGRKTKTKRISARTQAHYITAIKAFSRWLTHVRKVLAKDPLVAIKKPKFEEQRELQRRYLQPEEWEWLKRTKNAVLYETAIQTGLRSSELAALKPSNVESDHVWLPPRFTKNRKRAKQFISRKLAGKLKKALPFKLPPPAEVARNVFYPDLASARAMAEAFADKELSAGFLSRVDDNGYVLDFHSLRHTCGAWLAIAGVSPKTIQAVMRHGSIKLTLDTYGHLLPGAEQDAAELLSQMLADGPQEPKKCQ